MKNSMDMFSITKTRRMCTLIENMAPNPMDTGAYSRHGTTRRAPAGGSLGLNGTPENYEYWLSQAIRRTRDDYPNQERFVFINAWNEWAEGCHLEPCRQYGRRFLKRRLSLKLAGQY